MELEIFFCSSLSTYLLKDAPIKIHILSDCYKYGPCLNKKKLQEISSKYVINTVAIITIDRESRQCRQVFREPSSEFDWPIITKQ